MKLQPLVTLRATVGTLSAGDGRAPKEVAVPAGMRVRRMGQPWDSGFVEDFRKLGLNAWDEWDAEYRGVVVPLADCGPAVAS